MNSLNRSRIYLYILIASLIAPILIVTSGFFPYLGMGLAFGVYILIAYIAKKDKNIFTRLAFLITFILSLCLFIRSEPFLTFLNLAGIIYFGSLSLTEMDNKNSNLISLIISPLNLILGSLPIKSEYKLDLKSFKNTDKNKEDRINTVIVILFTIISLAVILPLLASANPIFKKLLSDIFDFLGLKNLHFSENVFLWIIRFMIFSVLIYLVPKMATYSNKKQALLFTTQGSLNMIIPKIVIASVLIIFFITQIQLYFATSQTLIDLGYTYSRYANEVFAQLSTVAAIILVLLYFEKENKKINNFFANLLSFEGIFLNLMAYKSAIDYISSWGFTYKRLYGIAVATLILGMFIIFLYGSYKKYEKTILLKSSLIFAGLILLMINLLNFDYLIYHWRNASTGQGIDYAYLARLSPDSLSYHDQFKRISDMDPKELVKNINLNSDTDGVYVLLFKIERLQNKFQNPDPRGFNLLEYLQYKKIEKLNTENIRENLISKP